MKRLAVLMLCLLCLLSACGKQEPTETEWSEAQMAQAIWDAQGPGDYQMLRYNYEDFFRYVADVYHISRTAVTGGAVFYAGGVSAREVAVLHLTDETAADEAKAALDTYINDRAGAFAGYAPEEYAILEQSGTVSRGAYVALLIGTEQEAAREAFAACFTTAPPEKEPTPPAAPAEPEPAVSEPLPEEALEPEQEPVELPEEPTEDPAADPQLPTEEEPAAQPEPESAAEPAPPSEPWSYDLDRLVSAWQSGDRSDLPEEDLEILAVCDQISPLTDGSLTDYQRELALHDWMVSWAEYDPGALSSGPVGDPMPHNDDPYGFLTGKKGICLGYATTFQLLMEMCGIECTIVHGTSHGGTAEHAWNMVRLDGELYCADVTWDDPVSSFPIPLHSILAHQYFNVTSAFLCQTDHQWDEDTVPEATATDFAWAGY